MSLPSTLFAVVAVALFAISSPGLADDSVAVEEWVRRGVAELDAAAIGRAGAADRALSAFDAALAAAPGHARARAGRGLALIARALEAPLPGKLPLAREGCAELDAAVAAAPDDPAVRLMRATSAVKLPLVLGRAAVAESDFAVLLAAARDERVTMDPATRRGIFFQAAAFVLKERRTGAIDLLERAASIEADRPTDKQVAELLALARRQHASSTHADHVPHATPSAP